MFMSNSWLLYSSLTCLGMIDEPFLQSSSECKTEVETNKMLHICQNDLLLFLLPLDSNSLTKCFFKLSFLMFSGVSYNFKITIFASQPCFLCRASYPFFDWLSSSKQPKDTRTFVLLDQPVNNEFLNFVRHCSKAIWANFMNKSKVEMNHITSWFWFDLLYSSAYTDITSLATTQNFRHPGKVSTVHSSN